MDIIHVIQRDHEEIRHLMDRLFEVAESEASEETARLANQLLEVVQLHFKSEEAALYEICRRRNKELRDFALEGYEEHQLVDGELEKLIITRPGEDGQFKAMLTVIQELLKHHAQEEEEQQLFPLLREEFSRGELEEMGTFMLEEKERLKEIPLTIPEASDELENNPAV